MTSTLGSALALVLALATSGCERREAHADPPGDRKPAPASVAGAIATVDVPGDARVWVVAGNPSVRRPIVYLHGMCADPRDDLEAWGGLAEEHGTVVALQGDVPCPDKPGRTKWTTDAAEIDARVRAALDAVSASPTGKLVADELVLVGESMGAARAEALAKTFPERYSRVVLVGSPQTPSPESFRAAKAVANLAGAKENQTMMREGAKVLENAGTNARFWLLPGATHGQYGPDGERIMSEAVGFVTAAR